MKTKEEMMISNMLDLIEEMGMLLESKYWTEEFRTKFNEVSSQAEIFLNK